TLQKLGSQELTFNPETVSLIPLIHELSRSFQEQWQDDKRKRLTLVVNEPPIITAETALESSLTLYIDSGHLRRILVELLTNAGNFSLPGTTVTLNVTEHILAGNNQIAIAVTNIGRGISPEEQKYIFEPFRRGQGVIEQAIAGTGLGLALVKGLVELLNGTIEISSHPTEENSQAYVTTFTLTLPQLPPQSKSLI
ncbi:MAG: sensor histidine kinase, partial [Microcystaceae cyanobacterium]